MHAFVAYRPHRLHRTAASRRRVSNSVCFDENSDFPCSFEDTHRLTALPFPAPEPAVSAQAPATNAPAATEAKPTEAPAQAAQPPAPAPSADLPAIPTTKPAPGMSATSGPLGEPDFGAEQKPEPTAAPTTAAAPAASAPAPTTTVPAEK